MESNSCLNSGLPRPLTKQIFHAVLYTTFRKLILGECPRIENFCGKLSSRIVSVRYLYVNMFFTVYYISVIYVLNGKSKEKFLCMGYNFNDLWRNYIKCPLQIQYSFITLHKKGRQFLPPLCKNVKNRILIRGSSTADLLRLPSLIHQQHSVPLRA